MLDSTAFAQELSKISSFAAGVPDSVLKHLCTALESVLPSGFFHTSVNEGAAVALCAGYTLATGFPGLVYMQNSGLGNAINPLLSLNDGMMYSIPVLLVIGWRGEPGVKDEPQHKKQGLVTSELLDVCRIPYKILSDKFDEAINELKWANDSMKASSATVAILVKNGLFSSVKNMHGNVYTYNREAAIECILSNLNGNEIVVSTTGMISRELYELRKKRGEAGAKDLILAGSMGHVLQVALGLALSRPQDKIICLDGDGSALMHMGSIASVGTVKPYNLFHIMLNNAAHDSVGGHPTCANTVDWVQLVKSCGYDWTDSVDNAESLNYALKKALLLDKCRFLEIKVAKGARSDLGRPIESPVEMKHRFRKSLTQVLSPI
jgi:phosphonopyruvate decarboxylase